MANTEKRPQMTANDWHDLLKRFKARKAEIVVSLGEESYDRIELNLMDTLDEARFSHSAAFVPGPAYLPGYIEALFEELDDAE